MKRGSPYGFKRNEFVFPALEAINKAAYWDYQRERVYVKSRYKTKFPAGAKNKTQDRAEAQYVDRISATVAVSSLQFKADLSSWQEKYDTY